MTRLTARAMRHMMNDGLYCWQIAILLWKPERQADFKPPLGQPAFRPRVWQ